MLHGQVFVMQTLFQSDERGSSENETYGFVAYTITPGEGNEYTIKDFEVYNFYFKRARNHILRTERFVKQIEGIT